MHCAALAAFLEKHQSRLAEADGDEWRAMSVLIETLRTYGAQELEALPKARKAKGKTRGANVEHAFLNPKVTEFAAALRASRGEFETGMGLASRVEKELNASELKTLAAQLNLGSMKSGKAAATALRGWVVQEARLRAGMAKDLIAE